ncbi:FAD-dependent oxidoreductase [Phragmitibacter flavus]|uniref:FAD-dependent oxidoreductase n=1 Tax=Phragmitibacter flavus TaxID=2576071 RepID=A0A5R8KI01_9BACT|nr:NAD(P)-binding protein [Phragmitibacter flavus]TLD71239.1 FAD-dependent oxidoreductase [Phragmitibacter flavus]
MTMMRRRRFIQGTAGALCLTGCEARKGIRGEIVGQSHALGHRLRDGLALGSAARKVGTEVVVVGAGISGLVAALRLQQAGVERITLLDMEAEVGGNARSGVNGISKYPWGAHYVPVPGADAHEVGRLFEELGVITGRDAAGRAVFDDRYVCGDPVERLLVNGVWQEGLVPTLGASKGELEEMERFLARMEELKGMRGVDGKRVFEIPVDESSMDGNWRELDLMTMEAWMTREGFVGERVRWLVDYACRDDYGASSAQVSAWAGLHYFASRESDEVLTWAEGNGWLVARLMEKMKGVTFERALVQRIWEEGDRVMAEGLKPDSGEVVRWEAKAAVCALPRFVAQRVVAGLGVAKGLVYSPWVVANLSWNATPPPAWDNVLYQGNSLGYVVATHQALNQPFPQNSVLTWYQTRDQLEPALARQKMLSRSWESWRDEVLDDLRVAHPDVEDRVTRLDVMLWGHGMIRPVPGFITGRERSEMALSLGRVAFAHTDMSGISIFEEACERGAQAARQVMGWMKG